MRKSILLFIILLLATSACTRRPKPTLRSLLQEVEDVVHTAPDSAYYLLQNALAGQTLTEEDSIYCQLLTAEVQLHNQQKLEDTAAMHNLTLYYKEKQDTLMQARAQRLYAAAHRDLGFYDATVQHYNTAIALAQKTGYKRLLADVYFELAHLHYTRRLNSSSDQSRILADSIFHLTTSIAKDLQDTTLWTSSLISKSLISRYYLKYNEEKDLLLSALKLAEESKNKEHEATISMFLSLVYANLGDKDKSYSFIQRNLSLRKGLIPDHTYYMTLGNAFLRIGIKDSADYYLNKGKMLKEKTETQYITAPNLFTKTTQTKTAILKQHIEQTNLNNNHKQQTTKNHQTYIISIIICLTTILLSFLYIKKRQKRNEVEIYRRIENEKRQLIKEKSDTQKLLKQKEKELTIKQQELEALSSETLHVFDKINQIIKDYLHKDSSEFCMEETDWALLQIELDKQWNHAISLLQKEFQLKGIEVRLLCLDLMDIPTARIPYLLNRTRSTIYEQNRKLFKTFKIERTSNSIKEDLKNFIHSRI